MSKSLPAIILLLLASACGSEDLGSPPEISDLNYTPSSVQAGELATVQGTLLFEDPDADLLEMVVTLSDPAGNESEMPGTEVVDAAGKTSGIVTLQLALALPQPGIYPFTVRVVDQNGNDSNALSGSITAE